MLNIDDIVKSVNLYLLAKDQNLKYIYCNEPVARALDLDSPSQIVGKTDYDLFADPLAQGYRSADLQILNGSGVLNIHELHPHVDGKTMQILTTKNALRNQAGDIRGVAISFIDVTGKSSDLLPSMAMQYDTHSQTYKFTISNQSESFTQREYDVFKHILLGLTAKQIAKKILLSPRTVEDYIDRIKHKLQCTSKYHIAETAMRLGIIQQMISK